MVATLSRIAVKKTRVEEVLSATRAILEAWIIDPALATRTALQSAASIAGLVITTECLTAYFTILPM